jgi:serine protease
LAAPHPGITISGNRLEIAASVTPGTHTFTIRATNELGSAVQLFTLTVTAAPIITSENNAELRQYTPSAIQLTATGTMPITYSLDGEPAGVTINNNRLVFANSVPVGTHTFTIRATNIVGSGEQLFTLRIIAPPVITSPDTLRVTAGLGGSLALTATGTVPIRYSLNNAPWPVRIVGSQLVIDPVAPGHLYGTYPFEIWAVNDIAPHNVQQFTLIVGAAPRITSENSFNTGFSNQHPLVAVGTGTITFTLVGAPFGVTISGSNLVIDTDILVGPPGTHTFRIRATNDFGVDYQNFTLRVAP